METTLLREATFPPKIADGPDVSFGSLVVLGVSEPLPLVEKFWDGGLVADDADVAAAADVAGAFADDRDDEIDFCPPSPLLLGAPPPPKRASRLDAASRL